MFGIHRRQPNSDWIAESTSSYPGEPKIQTGIVLPRPRRVTCGFAEEIGCDGRREADNFGDGRAGGRPRVGRAPRIGREMAQSVPVRQFSGTPWQAPTGHHAAQSPKEEPMEEQNTKSPLDQPVSPEFARQLQEMMEAVQQGRTASEVLLRFTHAHETETLQYCIHRMTEPGLSLMEEATISRFLQQAGMVQQFVESLLSLDRGSAQNLVRKLQNAERGLDLKIAPFLQSEDDAVVMRSLELLEVIGESKQLVPLLFSLINSENPRIQAKAALVIQKLDTEHAYTRRLLQHPDARVRANALEAIADRADEQGAEFLRQGLADTDHRVRTLAAVGLTRLGNPVGLQVLWKMARHNLTVERRSAAWGLGACGEASVLPRLELIARTDPDERVRELAAQGCQAIRSRLQEVPS